VLINNGREPSLSDHRFHQQMVYAVCSSTYNVFRLALGRDPSWGFKMDPGRAPVLRIRPHAKREKNAYYDTESGELRFGYYASESIVHGLNMPGGTVFTCLSHDIIVHEMTHALLDGMRARFLLPTNPDVLAFHEGFADLVAVFQHFSYPEVVRGAIERQPEAPESDNLMASIAAQFGHTTGSERPLRSAIDFDAKYDPASSDPHQLGSVLVSAVFEAFTTVFRRKTARYRRLAGRGAGGPVNRDLAVVLAERASRLASQFLSICIRAIDYCPPVDLRFGEYLRALITADFDLVPDDPWAYREALIEAFAHRGIYPEEVLNLSEDALLWRPPARELESIKGLHFSELRFAGDPGRAADAGELQRQARAVGAYVTDPTVAHEFGLALPHDQELGGDTVDPPSISSVRSIRRVGPDKEVTFDTVAEIVQRRELRSSEGSGPTEFYGGSTIILGPDGRIRYVISKSITNEARMAAEAAYAISTRGTLWQKLDGRLQSSKNALRELHRARMSPAFA
jgi:hypothetical protein